MISVCCQTSVGVALLEMMIFSAAACAVAVAVVFVVTARRGGVVTECRCLTS
jgi:hypothetical protein